MMRSLRLVLLFILLGCKKESGTVREKTHDGTSVTDTVTASQDTTSYPSVDDVAIILNDDFISGYPKELLDNYSKWFNDINDSHVVSPKIAFEKLQDNVAADYGELKNRFTGEVGEDSFYVLYGHFLQEKNGTERFKSERENILNLFRCINEINRQLQYGGTFFGHQEFRIYGHAEYALYEYADNGWLVKKYSIDKQKKLFLDSIRQRILDEEEHDFETLGKAKIVRRKELFQLVDKMDKLITNFFYLKAAQEFQYSNYL
ncbi:MAG: hypothetical protein ACO1N9_03680 [Flavobacterium sp.]